MNIKELQSQMATQIAKITSLLGHKVTYNAKQQRQRVRTARTTTDAFEQKKKTGAWEQRVLEQDRLVKGCARVGITLYSGEYLDVGTRAQMAQQTSK